MNKIEDGFKSNEEAQSHNDSTKYSILSEAETIKKYSDDSFEFLLEYPELTGYNRWKQSIFPTKEPNNFSKSSATDYYPISITWNTSSWGGLSRSVSVDALLDGMVLSDSRYRCNNF